MLWIKLSIALTSLVICGTAYYIAEILQLTLKQFTLFTGYLLFIFILVSHAIREHMHMIFIGERAKRVKQVMKDETTVKE
jgi:hypothetical protein